MDLHNIALDPRRNINQRKQAIGELDDPGLLANVAKMMGGTKDDDKKIAEMAVTKLLRAPESLVDIALNARREDVSQAVLQTLRDQNSLAAVAIYVKRDKANVGIAAVEQLRDKDLLAQVAIYAKWESIGLAAVRNLRDQDLLAEVAVSVACDGMECDNVKCCNCKCGNVTCDRAKCSHTCVNATCRQDTCNHNKRADIQCNREKVGLAAVEKLRKQELLAEVAKIAEFESICLEAVKNLINAELLDDVAKNAWLANVCDAAKKRMDKEKK